MLRQVKWFQIKPVYQIWDLYFDSLDLVQNSLKQGYLRRGIGPKTDVIYNQISSVQKWLFPWAAKEMAEKKKEETNV